MRGEESLTLIELTIVMALLTIRGTRAGRKLLRVDTYIDWSCLSEWYSAGPADWGTRPIKLITVVVRQSGTSLVVVREQGTFTLETGS